MSSNRRKSLAGILASVALLALRPGTVSIAQGDVPCPATAATAVVGTQPATASQCAQPEPAQEPVPEGSTPAAEPPKTEAPVSATEAPAPADAPAAAEPTAPAGQPAVEPPPVEAPGAEAPAAEAQAPPRAAEQPAPAPAPGIGISAQPPVRGVPVARQPRRSSAARPERPAAGKAKRPTGKARRAATGRKPALRRAADQPAFPTVSVDWTKLDPLGLRAFPAEVASTFPGPRFLLPIYHAAAAQFDVPWHVLAAINEIETGFGANTNVSSAGAVGWMQFMPSTWKRWGMDANGDGHANPHDPVDAIFSAARYLRAAGAPDDLPRAIFAYNHAGWYVEQVSRRAAAIGSIPTDVLAALTAAGRRDADAIERATGSPGLLDPHAEVDGIGRVMLMTDRRLRRHVLRSKRVHVYECGREDILRGIVDRRVLETLLYLAYRDLEPTVTSLRCGHGHYTKSGNVSHHSSGDAVDVAAINGTPVLGNQGKGSITDGAVRELLKLGGAMKAAQIITLMAYEGAPNALAMGDHHDHIHIGFQPVRPIRGNHGAVHLGHRHGRR